MILIPARYNSTRLPGKPLVPICGVPAIRRMVEIAEATGMPYRVITDDPAIAAAAQCGEGGGYLITGDAPTGTDRCAGVVKLLPGIEYFLILSGDELCADPVSLTVFRDHMLDYYQNYAGTILTTPARYSFARLNKAGVMDISRQPIGEWEATGIYWYPRHILEAYPKLLGENSDKEGIELLRVIENGHIVKPLFVHKHPGLSLNTPEDIPLIEAWLQTNMAGGDQLPAK